MERCADAIAVWITCQRILLRGKKPSLMGCHRAGHPLLMTADYTLQLELPRQRIAGDCLNV